KGSEKLMQDLNDLKNSVMGVVNAIVGDLTPKIDAVVVQFNDWLGAGDNKKNLQATILQWIDDFSNGIVRLKDAFVAFLNSQAFKDFKTDVVWVATEAQAASDAVGGWNRVLEIFAGFWIAGKAVGMIKAMREFLWLA